jgi:pimeloyl-ACP methyl ester carboxylesterase
MALPPLVFIPGLQGRWEYMRRAVDALAPFCRVLTFSLDEVDASRRFNRDKGLDGYVDHIQRMLDAQDIDRAVICGVSFGGVVALRFAARRPERTSALILVSTPGLRWSLARRQRLFTRFPWLTAPLFFVGMPRRLREEIVRAIPDSRERAALRWEQARTLGRAPVSPRRMAARARLIATADAASECARVVVPTLIVTGEPALDRIVSVSGSDGAGGTLGYARLIPGARVVQLDRTGHLGSITRPREFAAAIGKFLADVRDRHAA